MSSLLIFQLLVVLSRQCSCRQLAYGEGCSWLLGDNHRLDVQDRSSKDRNQDMRSQISDRKVPKIHAKDNALQVMFSNPTFGQLSKEADGIKHQTPVALRTSTHSNDPLGKHKHGTSRNPLPQTWGLHQRTPYSNLQLTVSFQISQED